MGTFALKHAGESEDVMRKKSGWVAGVFVVMAVTGVVSASASFVDVSRVDVIGDFRETVAQLDGIKAQGERARVDMIDNIGPEGAVYSYTKPTNR